MLSFSITGGDDADLFTIGESTGELAFKEAPDFEDPEDYDSDNVYEVEVGVSDGVNTTTQVIYVTVSDMPENLPPQITSPATAAVKEGDTVVMTVTATDPDEGGGPGPGPGPSEWPDASNTGAKGQLVPSGDVQSSGDGQVIENLDVSGTILITGGHIGVIVRNCRAHHISQIDGNSGAPSAGQGCIVEDCTVTGSGTKQRTGIQLGGRDGLVQRCDVSGVENGINVEAITGGVVRDNYLHDLASPGNPDPHYDMIVCQGGQHDILIEHNSTEQQGGLSAVMFIKTDFGPISDVVVNNNRFRGGGFTVYADNKPGGMSNITYTNNRLGGWVYGPLYEDGISVQWSGNVNDDTGDAIPHP